MYSVHVFELLGDASFCSFPFLIFKGKVRDGVILVTLTALILTNQINIPLEKTNALPRRNVIRPWMFRLLGPLELN